MVQIQPGGVYKFVNAKAENCMDLSGGDGASVIGFDYHGGDNQKWKFEKPGTGWTIQNVGNGKYLNIAEDPQDGTKVVGTTEQREWDISPDEQDADCYRFAIPNSAFNLDLSDHGNPTPGTPITLWGKWEGRNQCWRVEEA